MPRTCIACRKTAEPDELIRLVATPEAEVGVDIWQKIQGRGAWVCPTRSCLEVLERRPGSLSKALHVHVNPVGLKARVEEAELRALRDALSMAARAGCVAGGAEQLADRVTAGGYAALVAAVDAAPRSVADARRIAPDIEFFTVSLDRAELGRQVGKGPRAVLAIRDARPGRAVIRELRRMAGLG